MVAVLEAKRSVSGLLLKNESASSVSIPMNSIFIETYYTASMETPPNFSRSSIFYRST